MKKNSLYFMKWFIYSFIFIGTYLMGATATESYKDEFNSGSYSNNDGTYDFTDNWDDTEDHDPSSGKIYISGGDLVLKYIKRGGWRNSYDYKILRNLNLEGWNDNNLSAITLTITYDYASGSGDAIKVEMKDAGGGWQQVGSFGESGDNNTFTYQIEDDYLISNTGIRLSATNNWESDDKFEIHDITISSTYLDTDEDGVSDKRDIDDDNDGILDQNETKKVNDINGSSGTIPDNGYSDDCLDRTFNISESGSLIDITVTVDIDHTWRGDLVVSLISPDNNTTVDLTSDNGSSADNLKVLFEDNASESIVDDDSDQNSIVARIPEEGLSKLSNTQINGIWTLHMCDDASQDEGTFNEAKLAIYYFSDSDSDGVIDRLDLDSDNDGIPDNVEGQSTGDYVVPSGTDSDNDGLDDAYDPDDNGNAVALPDTDSDGILDFIDSDSDSDGYTDCEEGIVNDISSKHCPVGNSTVGNNGLVSWAESSDDYSTPNGIVSTPILESGSKMQNFDRNSSELDFRHFADNDGDGVSDLNDIDDDNDGIIDSMESPCLKTNGGFESPDANTATWTLIDEDDVPFWKTSASDDKIEFWKDGFLGVPAYEGNQLVEINANEVASLYQDFSTKGGETLHWTIAHHGRDGVDVATVTIGAPGALQISTTMSDGNTEWGVYNGTYRVPINQTTTRISFDSISESGGRPSYGNLIDGFCVRIDRTDSDGDGLFDFIDLDSDNDGIPDNVEAQSTENYDAPSSTWADADGDGLADQYDQNDSGVPGSIGLIPPDTDGDGIRDFIDTDSDNDGYTDCEEGLSTITGTKVCPVDGNNTGYNGLIDWAENSGGDIYWDTDHAVANGNVNDPDPESNGDLEDEVSNNHEAAYREFLCGKALTTLTERHWKLISIPCQTGDNSVQDIFSQLGTYGDDANFVMYRQLGTDNYEVNSTYKNTVKEQLSGSSKLVQGISYWIIWDDGDTTSGEEINITIDKGLSGLSPTSMTNASDEGISNDDFTKIHKHTLPDNQMTISDSVKKYMAGNPFPFAFMVEDLYFSHGGSSGSYKAMGNSNNDTYIDPTFYKHDSADRSDLNTSNGGGYEAVNAGTPGFDHGGIKAMEGFFIKIEKEESDSDANYFAYPLRMK